MLCFVEYVKKSYEEVELITIIQYTLYILHRDSIFEHMHNII